MKPQTLVKTNVRGLMKDTASQAILNTDTAQLKQIHGRRQAKREQDELLERVKRLEAEMAELRRMVVECRS